MGKQQIVSRSTVSFQDTRLLRESFFAFRSGPRLRVRGEVLKVMAFTTPSFLLDITVGFDFDESNSAKSASNGKGPRDQLELD